MHRTKLSFALLSVVVSALASASGQSTFRASVGPLGLEGDDDAEFYADVSDDGNVIAFASIASNLVAGDSVGTYDVFVRDVAADTLTCVSVDVNGVPGTGFSILGSVSGDGRYVVFESDSPTLIPGDTNNREDVFLYDRTTATLSRVSVDSSGAQAKGDNFQARMSRDGNFVAFTSSAPNLVANDTNGHYDIFVRDLQAGTTERVSVDASGLEVRADSAQPSISSDGRYVAFTSLAKRLVSGDTNGAYDIFVKDRQTGAIDRASVDSAGVEGNSDSYVSSVSDDGLVVAFESFASNLVSGDTNGAFDVFVHDFGTGLTTRETVDENGAEVPFGGSLPRLSADGRYVAFVAFDQLIAAAPPYVVVAYVRDRVLGWILTPAIDSNGVPSASASTEPAFTGDGRFIAFLGFGDDLVAGDTNGKTDVFVHETSVVAASAINTGGGLAGTFGVPALTATPPQATRDCTITLDNSLGAATLAVLFFGDTAGVVPTKLGANLLLIPQLVVPIALPAGGTAMTETVPADEFLLGDVYYFQAVEIDAGALHGVSFTPRLDLTIGR